MLTLSKNPKDIVFWNAFCPSPTNKHVPAVMYRTIGPYKLAHSLRSCGFAAQVIDFVTLMSEDELFDFTIKFIDEQTRCLAISTTYLLDAITNLVIDPKIINVINRVIEQFPNLHLVFGGYGIGMLKKSLHQLKKKTVIFVSQYGEDIILDLVRYLKGVGQRPRFEIEFDPTGTVTINTYSTAILPAYDIQRDNFRFTKDDAIQPKESLPIELSRGCIFKCKFCNHLLLGRGKLDYLREMELVKEELLYNYENWGTTNYYVLCDTFNDTEYKLKAWADMLATLPFKIRYTAYLRADLLDRFPDTPYILKESGLVSAFHGIETLGKTASQTIGKGWSGQHAKEYIPKLYHDIWNGEVYQTVSLIAGLPGDTREILTDTAHWVKDNDLYNVAWHTLGLATNLTAKNSSEFERNATQYGYTMNYNAESVDDWKWKTDYWSDVEVNQFLRTKLLPIIRPNNSSFNSWSVVQLLQYGVSLKSFKKENLSVLTPMVLGISATTWLRKYKKTLAEL
jgi:hypothetical protein